MDIKVSKPKHKPRLKAASESARKGEITIKARLWLDVGGETYLAPGRATLLERIEEYGSITKAAKSMEMSYRHAWLLVDDINKKAPSPLVLRSTGGKGGGGTLLTDEGKQAVKSFNKMMKKLNKFLETAKI